VALDTGEAYQAFCRAAGNHVAVAIGTLGLISYSLADQRAGFLVDESVFDLARFLFTPRAKVDGFQRDGKVLVLREQPYTIADLPRPPVSVEPERVLTAKKKAERRQPSIAAPSGHVREKFDDAATAYNKAHAETWPQDSGTCPACGHKGCFGTVPETGGQRWSCFSDSHVDCGKEGDGCWSGDQLDLDAYAEKLTRFDLLVKEGYLRPAKAQAVASTTVEDLLAAFDKFAEAKPTAAQWREYWLGHLHKAKLGPIGAEQALDHLVKLGVGGKRPLKTEWREFGSEQARIQQQEEALVRRQKTGKVVVNLGLGEERTITAVEAALVAARDPELPLLRDLNGYVRPVVDRPEWGKARQGQPIPTVAMLASHTEASLRWGIERHLELELEGQPQGPGDTAARLLQNPLPKAPTVRGLITAPLVRADGRLIDQPGLDAESELYLHLGGKLGEAPPFIKPPIAVPDDPVAAKKLAQQYVQEMLGLYADYRFEEPIDKEVALVARLSLLTRKDLDIAPCYLLVGPERGTGKTTLAAIDHAIVTGHDIPASYLTGDSEKDQQSLFSMFSASPAAVLYDNLLANCSFGNEVLAQALTKGVVETRRFHAQTTVKATTNAQLYFTGNAITLNEDLQARTLEVRFSSERPKKWSHPDWLAHARSIREDVRVKLQFVQRAYIRHGAGAEGVYTRFPNWAKRVRDPMLWAGLSDIGARFQALEDQNPNRIVDGGIAAELRQQFGGEKFTAGEVVVRMGASESPCEGAFTELRNMVTERVPRALGKTGAQHLGQFFREHLMRWLRMEDGRRVKLGYTTEKGCARWRVEEQDATEQEPPAVLTVTPEPVAASPVVTEPRVAFKEATRSSEDTAEDGAAIQAFIASIEGGAVVAA
jgi:putative DNA primase/helicase